MNVASTNSEQNVDNYIKPRITWTPSQLAHAFPNSLGVARRKRSSLIATIFFLQDTSRYIHKDPSFEFKVNFVNIDGPIIEKMSQLEFLDKYIRLAEHRRDFTGNTLDIARAKQAPITSFIEVGRGGFASCPFHKDKSPSLKYYEKENRWHCFSCNKGGDVIDLIQEIKSCTLAEAVKFLT